MPKHPVLSPSPLRTNPEYDFAFRTFTDRLPTNIRNIVRSHPEYPEGVKEDLRELARSIQENAVMPPLSLPAWDHELWQREFAPYEGQRWHDTVWFFAETYAFRLVLQASRFFENRIDPFGPLKVSELESGAPFLPLQRFFGGTGAIPLEQLQREGRTLPPEQRTALLEEAVHLCMWGNKADISFSAGGELDHSEGERELLVMDDAAPAAALMAGSTTTNPATVHIIMDNSGAELGGDLLLALATILLTGAPVVLHPKLYPTYVSDTVVEDIWIYLDHAERSADPVIVTAAGALREFLNTGLITMAPDDFWCGATFLDQAPRRIEELLSGAAVVIFKGDYNYRRVFRDTVWPLGTDPIAAAGRVVPWPMLFLRTLKSDCLAGADPVTIGALDRTEPGWRSTGKRGLIQLVR